VLLLHGFPTSSHMFRNLIPALADRYRVIAPDYPGYGQSDMPDRTKFTYTFDRFGELVDGLLDQLGAEGVNLPAPNPRNLGEPFDRRHRATFALADGDDAGADLRVVQLTSPETTPGYLGFSPRPSPSLVATWAGRGSVIAVSRGIDRDRAVDESGNQIAVFGRRGARPLDAEELAAMILRGGKPWTVDSSPAVPPLEIAPVAPDAGRIPAPPPGEPYTVPKRR
jgi:hypothetical protein